MNLKRHLLETATLVAAAALCAFVANLAASRDRKVALPGHYENATTSPIRMAPSSLGDQEVASSSTPSPVPTASPALIIAAPVASTPLPGCESHLRSTPSPNAREATRPAEAVASAGSPPASPPAERLTRRFPPHPDKPFVEASGADVAWLQARGALFLDARRTSVFQEGHIAGARPISVWEADVDEKVMALVNEGRDTQQPVVIYCSGGDCEDSHMLAQKLFGAGFNNLIVYKDGWPDWQKRGGPSRTGMES